MKLLRRLHHWMSAGRRVDELREELEAHRAMLQAELEAGGMAPRDAAAASRRAIGNAALAREDAREVWTPAAMDRLWRDARQGVRALRRERSFAVTAIVTLALGVATTTSSFSVVDAELWKPLPYPDPDRLVAVYTRGPGARAAVERISGADFLDWAAGSRAFTSLAAIGETRRRVLQRNTAESILTATVTWNYFATLGRDPTIGRTFSVQEAREGGALLSEGAWRRLFGSDPGTVGRTIAIDGQLVRVAGVVPADQAIESVVDVFLPIDPGGPEFLDRAGRSVSSVIGRMRPGVARAAAEAELRTIAARIAREFPDGRTGRVVYVEDLRAFHTGFNWRPMYFLLGASVLVLALTCVNVAGLLLVRALRRQREFAIRGALGGGTATLLRQLLVEGVLVAVPAGAAALLLTHWILGFVTTQVPPEYLVRGSSIPIDARVYAVALGVTALTAMMCGLVPAALARRVDLNVTLAGGGRTAGWAPARSMLRQLLAGVQIALTLMLLAGAGLFLKSYAALTQVPLGFAPRDRAALRVTLSGQRYETDGQIQDYANRLLERAGAIGGVAGAAVATSSPLNSGPLVQFAGAGDAAPASGEEPRAIFRATTPRFFDVLGIPVLEGRSYTSADVAGAPRVALINEVLARRLFAGRSPVGRMITLLPGARAPWTRRPGNLTIIGVVGNVKEVGLDEVEFNDIYVPFAQAPSRGIELIVHAAIPADTIAQTLRAAAAGIDPNIPSGPVLPLESRVEQALREDRFHLLLIGSFALMAVALAAIGVYGAVASVAHQRRREFGVRIALGARPARLLLDALREPFRIAIAGGALGAGSSLLVAMLLGDALYLVPGQHNGLLFGVKTTDPLVLGCALAAVVAVALVAAAVPAREVAGIDPLSVLREE